MAPGRPRGGGTRWGGEPEPEDPSVRLIAGTSFVICRPDGTIEPGGSSGFFASDTRLLSIFATHVTPGPARLLRWETSDRRLTSYTSIGPISTPTLLITSQMDLSTQLDVAVEIENLTGEHVDVVVEVEVGSDFADLFDVKQGVEPRGGYVGSGASGADLVLAYENEGFRCGTRVHADRPMEVLRDGLRTDLSLAPRSVEVFRLTVRPEDEDGREHEASPYEPVERAPWPDEITRLGSSDPGVDRTWRVSCADLASLLLCTSTEDRYPVVAAGLPWYLALFGRDSLITGIEALSLGHELLLGVLQALAQRQGRRTVPETAEQPGRILHEVRAGEVVRRAGGWGHVYYGSVDATPLFVIALGAASRAGAPDDEVRELLPAAEAAVGWILGPGDPDGDGFVEYPGAVPAGVQGLANQGWKDSHDGIVGADGSIPEGPIALIEVQGYCHAALRTMADLRETFGTADPDDLRQRAEALGDAIDDAFWMDDLDCYALALDGRKHQVRSITSNAGHLLWTSTARADRVPRLCRRLLEDDMFSGFGIRTLSADHPSYNPLSYHRGSVWPHDTALVTAGMLGHGHDAGMDVVDGLLGAADSFDGRLPELFSGHGPTDHDVPVPYPASCSPQAWAAAAPLMLLRSLDDDTRAMPNP
jgi:glycogen debranching enzyme